LSGAYLEEVKTALAESMCDFQVVEFEAEEERPGKKSGYWKILKPSAITAGL
jgi:hypothetical protein